MDNNIFSQFPDRETFDKYWNENYVPVTYEDVAVVFRDFVKSAEGHIYLSDYEEKGCISKEDFKDNLSQEAQFAFQDGLTEVFYDKNPDIVKKICSLICRKGINFPKREKLIPDSQIIAKEMIKIRKTVPFL